MTKKNSAIIVLYTALSLLIFALVLIIPASREVFIGLSGDVKTKYFMGFAKFAILATAGELLSSRLARGEWTAPAKIVSRFVIWGFIGVWITFMMGVFFTAAGSDCQQQAHSQNDHTYFSAHRFPSFFI